MSTLKVNSIIPVAGVPTGGGGGIIQVVATNVTATSSFSLGSTTTLNATPLTVDITSLNANSRFLISAAISGEASQQDHDVAFVMRRTIGGSGTSIAVGTGSGNRPVVTRNMSIGFNANDQDSTTSTSAIVPYLDSPSQAAGTTITYSISVMEHGGTDNHTFYFNRTLGDTNNQFHERPMSYITVMEVSV